MNTLFAVVFVGNVILLVVYLFFMHKKRPILNVYNKRWKDRSMRRCDKDNTTPLMNRVGIPTVKQIVTREELTECNLRFPVVVKPARGTCCGNGVNMNVQSLEEVNRIIASSKKKHLPLAVEEQCTYKYGHRLLSHRSKGLIEVYRRIPPFVTGDGVSTIKQLVALANENPAFRKIRCDNSVDQSMVPSVGETVTVRQTDNISKGATAVLLQVKDIHPEIKQWCKTLHKELDLEILGIDVLSDDLNDPKRSLVLEVNMYPGFVSHKKFRANAIRFVDRKILEFIVVIFLVFNVSVGAVGFLCQNPLKRMFASGK